MRITRVIAVLVALALVALGSIAITSGASTAQEGALQAKPRHNLSVHGKELRNDHSNKFVAYGRVTTFKGRTITVQRKNCGKCDWKFYKETRTSEERGKFRTRIAPGERVPSRVCYRVVVPGTKNYRRTKAPVGCIDTEPA